MTIELATTLFAADEFSRAANQIGEIMSARSPIAGDASLLRCYDGISHSEIGEVDTAIDKLRAFCADGGPADALYPDAKYQLGMMLTAIGQTGASLQDLEDYGYF
jgi:hypothetical protein